MVTITEPGVYYDLSSEDYHAQHEWLSASGIKKLIPPSTPAHFKAAQGAEEFSDTFDLGKAVHTKVLGDGDRVVVVEASSWRTKTAQEARSAARASGTVPILEGDLAMVDGIAASVAAHPEASALLSTGRPEVSLFWVDPETGVKCRARLDWLPEKTEGRRLIVPDLKSAVSAAPSEFSKAAAWYGYYAQQEHYRDGIIACGLDPNPAFLFIVAEKSSPYLVTVGQFAERDDIKLARAAVDKARRIYAACIATDTWPGYPGGVVNLSLPTWLHYDLEAFVS